MHSTSTGFKSLTGKGISSLTNRHLLKKYSTVVTIATFAVAAVSGVLLFFDIGHSYLEALHEWIAITFVVAVVLHVTRHFRPFVALLNKFRTWVAISAAALVAVVFIGASILAPGGGSPIKQLIEVSLEAPVSALSHVIGQPTEEISRRFAEAGISGIRGDESLKDIAIDREIEESKLLEIMLSSHNSEENSKTGQ